MFMLLLSLPLGAGCFRSANARYETVDRENHGLIIILPGIEGVSPLNKDIRSGLVAAGLYRSMPIYSWGNPLPVAGMLLNQMDFIGNHRAGKRIANKIVKYQDKYPGRPVYIIGHSGGGGVAVFAAENMPEDHKIDGLILLSASISSSYDLTKALEHTRNGILNIYSKGDVGFLVVGTTLAGNVDGTRGPAAGALGFDKPKYSSNERKIMAYHRLYQMELTDGDGEGLSHTSTTRSGFVARNVAPWVFSETWPAMDGGLSTSAYDQ